MAGLEEMAKRSGRTVTGIFRVANMNFISDLTVLKTRGLLTAIPCG